MQAGQAWRSGKAAAMPAGSPEYLQAGKNISVPAGRPDMNGVQKRPQHV